MSRLGKRIIKSLKEFIRNVEAGKPFKQTIVRRMRVKGKTVYARETFNAPLRKVD
jgi:hypothetical protein